MKKAALALICIALVLMLAGCTVVNSDNSFQQQAPESVGTTQQAQTTEAQVTPEQQTVVEPTSTPTPDPQAPGYNG